MCLWFQSSYCISCGSKIGENTKFSPYRCSVCFGYYLFGLLTVTGIGFTSTMTFRPNISWTPFIGMITGPIDTILNIILFVPLGFSCRCCTRNIITWRRLHWLAFCFLWLLKLSRCLAGVLPTSMTWWQIPLEPVLDFSLLSAVKNLACQSEKQLQSSRVNAVAEVLLFAICTFAIMVTAQTWFVHDVLNVP